jgi:hypothetical protein
MTVARIETTERSIAEAIAEVYESDDRMVQDALAELRAAVPDPFAGLDVPFTDMEGVR